MTSVLYFSRSWLSLLKRLGLLGILLKLGRLTRLLQSKARSPEQCSQRYQMLLAALHASQTNGHLPAHAPQQTGPAPAPAPGPEPPPMPAAPVPAPASQQQQISTALPPHPVGTLSATGAVDGQVSGSSGVSPGQLLASPGGGPGQPAQHAPPPPAASTAAKQGAPSAAAQNGPQQAAAGAPRPVPVTDRGGATGVAAAPASTAALPAAVVGVPVSAAAPAEVDFASCLARMKQQLVWLSRENPACTAQVNIHQSCPSMPRCPSLLHY